MELAFICSPYGGKDENYKMAKIYMKMAAERGFYPLAPHVMIHGILDDGNQLVRSEALQVGLELIDLCQLIIIFGDEITPGMQVEIQHAHDRGYQMLTVSDKEILNWLSRKFEVTNNLVQAVNNCVRQQASKQE